jgi:hypothetical protein
MKLLVLAAVLIAVCSLCEGKVFTRCELVHELRRQNFPEHQMRDCK